MTDTLHGIRTTVLNVKWSTSRAQDSYGYPMIKLDDASRRHAPIRAVGGGYDMVGTVLGDWLQTMRQDKLSVLDVPEFYGFSRRDQYVRVNGACGLRSVIDGARAVGINIVPVYNRRGRITQFIVTEEA